MSSELLILVASIVAFGAGYGLGAMTASKRKHKGALLMAVQITDIQSLPMTVQAVDAKGNPTTLDTPPVWASSDATLLTVTPAADGLSAVAAAVGPEGAAQVQVSATVAGVALSGTLAVTIVGSAATALVITPGTPA